VLICYFILFFSFPLQIPAKNELKQQNKKVFFMQKIIKIQLKTKIISLIMRYKQKKSLLILVFLILY